MVEAVVRRWSEDLGGELLVEAVVAISKRPEKELESSIVALARVLNGTEEIQVCQEAPTMCETLQMYLANSRRKETLKSLLRRGDLSDRTLHKLAASRHEDIAGRARAGLIRTLEERIANTPGAGVEEIAEWSRNDGAYNEWFLTESGIDAENLGWRIDQYMPRRNLGEHGRTRLEKVLTECTNLTASQRRGCETYLEELEAGEGERMIIARAWGRSQAIELQHYVRRNFLREVEGWEDTWGIYLNTVISLGKPSIEKTLGVEWGDGATLAEALELPYSRPYALKSRLLTGPALEREIAAVLDGPRRTETGRDAGALCSNPNVPTAVLEQLAKFVDRRGVYGLYTANLSEQGRSEVMASHPEYVETLVLVMRMAGRGAKGPRELNSWFTPGVCRGYARLVEEGRVAAGTEQVYVRWANAVLETRPELKEDVLSAVKLDFILNGEVAEDVARMLVASKADPETLLGLMERWRGNVITLIKAAEKL